MSNKNDSNVSSRRKALATGALGVVAWKTPVLKAVVTPAHAQTSEEVTTTPAPVLMQVVAGTAATSSATINFPSS